MEKCSYPLLRDNKAKLTMKHFYDVPVYREDQNNFLRIKTERINKKLLDCEGNKSLYDFLEKSYGVWKFNEIIGYIRLYFSGHQVCGEYYCLKSNKLSNPRKKRFEYSTWKLAPEVYISSVLESDKIYESIIEYIKLCKKELPRTYYIDFELFEVLGKQVNWTKIIN